MERGGESKGPARPPASARRTTRFEAFLARAFGLEAAGTTLRREVIGGLTTFLTMSYIVLVNPAILSEAGVPFDGALVATCLSAALATLVMGLWARYPIALAPGMGLNAYFAYVAVPYLSRRYSIPPDEAWRVALGAVFCSGVVFLGLSAFRFRAAIVDGVPRALKLAVAAGIGLFIAFIGLQHAGVVVGDPTTLVRLGDLGSPSALATLAGLVVASALLARGIRAGVLIGIAVAAGVAALLGGVPAPTGIVSLPDPTSTLLALRPLAALRTGILTIVFVFLFVDLFDTVGTLIAVGEQAGFTSGDGRLPRAGRALQADAAGTVVGALLGTSTVTAYIESTAGIAAGARTGLANVVVAGLLLLCVFFSPVAVVIPGAATAPALILVGALMVSSLGKVDWKDLTECIPAFLTFAVIPLTFSISDGIAAGFLGYLVLKVSAGRRKEVSVLVWVLSACFLLRYLVEALLSGG